MWALLSSIALALALTGCVSKAKADAQAHAAFLAGQQQAMQRLQQPLGPKVIFLGTVDNPAVLWTPELTLAKAIVTAGYHGPDPTDITILRNGQTIHVDPNKLLNGEDVPLESGDIVSVK